MTNPFFKTNSATPAVTASSHMIHGCQKIAFRGRLVYGNTNNIKSEILGLIRDADGYMIDTLGLERIDSTGFGVLINLAKQLSARKRRMVIIVQDELMRELFIISKFHQLFPLVETEEQALKHLKGDGFSPALSLEDY